ncbi:hypothetical protein LPJ53_002272 [Coemansia erecta]|uniref:Muskelin N-terminal domain-containing protein n=1 Tax=Coemansia erecta TaxID=147472 RepID=A0A9W7Y3L7_9FUNG|nr:hypothetical protein LPJ53_002272 [Coemansia erecta]
MTASNGIQPNAIAQAGMSEADCGQRHAGLGDGELQQTPASADSSAQRPSPAAADRAYNLSAPFMTNANYRIIPPAPDAFSSAASTSLGAERARIALQSLVSDLPAWIASSARSKTYFLATSPIVDGGGAFTGENQPCHEGALGNQAGDSVDMTMQVDGVQELRTEYEVLPYEVHSWSSHSANFLPNNIIVDRPHDQASRWATVVNNHRQYITLRLERPALVRSIKFGKFYKSLRNDSEPEIISLRQKLDGYYIPCQFIKIQPLLAYDQKFNFSIWHVELQGTMDPRIMQVILSDFNRLKEQEVVRSCLRFFRDRGYNDAYNALERQVGTPLEMPVLTQIYKALVESRDYDKAECLLFEAEAKGMFSDCISKVPYVAKWGPADLYAAADPPARGGHQMCINKEDRLVYLYGGWDGSCNLGDFWVYSIDSGIWRCISSNTHNESGPGPRSCHSMCFDSVYKCVYIMGKYVEREYRGNTSLENDLYCYDTRRNEWIVLSENTEVQNGPKLLFNSQMVFDPRHCYLYVYGGKVVLPDSNDSTIVYSGMYRYDLRKHRWTRLKPDFHMLEQEHHVRGRYFHSMTIDSDQQRLYILSSKRDVSTPGDLFIYDIASHTFYEKMADLSATSPSKQPITQQSYLAEKQRLNPIYSAVQSQLPSLPPSTNDHHPHHVHVPQDGRTIRLTLDAERQELYVLASAQNDTGIPSTSLPIQSLLSMRNGRGLPSSYYEQAVSHHQYTSASHAQSSLAGAGFHPCSSLMDSGVRYDTVPYGATDSSGRSGSLIRSNRSSARATGGGSGNQTERKAQPFHLPTDHILMVVFCYHIPTETWTEVYNSARAAEEFVSAMNDPNRASSDGALGVGRIVPPFPLPRFAQDWVYDSTTRKHHMFGGNPSRPSDKSARFNDTWTLEFKRPTEQDILRRTLYLVRQRRFLDMCVGIGLPQSHTSHSTRPLGEFKTSAIPSPKTSLLDNSDPGSPNGKRSSPLCAGNGLTEHQSQRPRVSASISTTPSPSAVPRAQNVSMSAYTGMSIDSETEVTAASCSDSHSSSSSSSPSPTSSSISGGISTPTAGSAASAHTAQALNYLQRYIAPLVNYDDPSEYQSFHALSTALFQISSLLSPKHAPQSEDVLRKARADVYEALLVYFPESQQQPRLRLDDMVMSMLK